MRCPTTNTLVKTFQIDRKEALKIRRLAKLVDDREGLRDFIAANCPATAEYAARCYSDPFDSKMWRVTMALHAIDHCLGTFGVESLGPIDMRSGPPYEYCNTGDPYAATLIYKKSTDNLFIGDWATIAEKHPNW